MITLTALYLHMLPVFHGGLLPYIPPGHKILSSNFKDK